MKCVIGSTIYKNEGFLHKSFENIKKIQSLFDYCKIVICYDNSGDNSLKELCELKKEGFDIDIIINKKPRFNHHQGRAYNIGQARNQILSHIYDKYIDYNYFIMCDLDDVFNVNMNIDILQKYIPNKENKNKVPDWDNPNYEWDALSFYNKGYYDLWALSIDDYQDSVWSRDNPLEICKEMLTYLKEKIENTKENMIKVDSAFNGFCIHKLEKFNDINYEVATILNSNIIIDCEHRIFYKKANNKGLKIMMSKDCLFDDMKHIVKELY
tara:strand:+ start:420 stop:1223 length:804 start_codon:yes stop_codon:yes gene_type:complete